MTEYEGIWAKADEHFTKRSDSDMKAHAEAVLKFSRGLMERGEPGCPEVVIPAAILHDVGIPQAIALYGNAGPPGQEVEGAVIAREILVELGFEPARIEAICGIIAIHHHRLQHPTDEFKIIYDADLLVNAKDAGHPYHQLVDRFYTVSAKELAEKVLNR